jgi:chromosome segregation ATPase
MEKKMADATTTDKLQDQVKKLSELSKAKERKALHRRIKASQTRVKKLQEEEGDEAQKKNAPIISELQEKLSGLRGDLKKIMAEGRKSRTDLRRVQRKVIEERENNSTLEEKQARLQKLSDHVGQLSTDFQKTLSKGQINAFDHSLRKKVKSLTRRLKNVGRKIEAKKKKTPSAPAPAAKAEGAEA